MDSYEEVEARDEDLPRSMVAINFYDPHMVVFPDNLTVKFTGGLNDEDDDKAGVFQADIPAPTNCDAYYFEVHVNNAGDRGRIAIGFSTPRWRREERSKLRSCSYHGDSGFINYQDGEEEETQYSATDLYTTGDIVGCGMNYVSEQFFFTKNGELVKGMYKHFRAKLYPTVSLHSQNEEVTVIFNPESFRFDLQAYNNGTNEDRDSAIENISMPPSIRHELVRNYLLHYAYEDTFKAFNLATETDGPPIGLDESFALQDRKNLRELIMAGETDAALAIIDGSYPQFLEECRDLLSDLEIPVESRIDAVNAAILSSNPDYNIPLHSRLEAILRQLRACSYYYRQ